MKDAWRKSVPGRGQAHAKALGWEPAWDVRGSHCVWRKLKGRVEEKGSGRRLGQVVCVSWDISKTLPFTLREMRHSRIVLGFPAGASGKEPVC